MFSDNRTHFCTFITCTKAFRTADALKVHTLMHTDEKPLKCEHCEYTCRQKNSIKFHMKKKHPDLLPNDLVSTKSPAVGGQSVSTADRIGKSEDSQVAAVTSDVVKSISEPLSETDDQKIEHVEEVNVNKSIDSSEPMSDENADMTATVVKPSEQDLSNLDCEILTEKDAKVPDKTVPLEFNVGLPSVSTNQNHCNSSSATTSTNDLEETKSEQKKLKKTDMYEFQSEDESGDEMKPGKVPLFHLKVRAIVLFYKLT